MDTKEKKVLLEFWIWVFVGANIWVAFFIYGNYSQIWGTKFADMPQFVNYMFYGFAAFGTLHLFLFLRFLGKHQDFFSADKPKAKRQK